MGLRTKAIEDAATMAAADSTGTLSKDAFARAWAAAGGNPVTEHDVIRDWSLRLNLCFDEDITTGKVQMIELAKGLEQLGYMQPAEPAEPEPEPEREREPEPDLTP